MGTAFAEAQERYGRLAAVRRVGEDLSRKQVGIYAGGMFQVIGEGETWEDAFKVMSPDEARTFIHGLFRTDEGYKRGLVVEVDGKRIFYRDVTSKVLLKGYNAWALEVAAVADLQKESVMEVHYFDTESKVLYVVPLEVLAARGMRKRMNGREQFLLDRRLWEQRERTYEMPGP